MRHWLYFVIIVFVFCSCTCKKLPKQNIRKNVVNVKEIKDTTEKESKQKNTSRIDELRKEVKITPLIERWYHHIKDEKIKNLYLRDDIIIAVTESTYLYAFDRRTGEPIWAYKVGGTLDYPPTKYKDKLFILSTGNIHIVSTITGGQLLRKELTFAPSTAVCATDKYAYVGGWDKFLYAVNITTGTHDWRYRVDDHIWSTPVQMEGSLYFSTLDNKVFSISAQTGKTLNEWANRGIFNTFGANRANLNVQENPPGVFVGSRDYNLYVINRVTGTVNWKFESGGEVNKKPLVIGNSVYAISERKSGEKFVMHSLDTESGKLRWELEDGKHLFFQGKYNIWVRKDNKNLAGVDPEKGDIKEEFSLKSFEHFTSNTNSRLGYVGYMGTPDGYIFAVEEK